MTEGEDLGKGKEDSSQMRQKAVTILCFSPISAVLYMLAVPATLIQD